jgi:hypothetical protein
MAHNSIRVIPTARIAYVERGERECYAVALAELGKALGPAARVIDCGPFAGQWLTSVLDILERPKAGITIAPSIDPRLQEKFKEYPSTAQITHLAHDISTTPWPLEVVGKGTTIALLSGGAFGALSFKQGFDFLESAGQALLTDDFVALTLATVQDGAVLEALYEEHLRPLSNQALNHLAKGEAFTPTAFFDPSSASIKFGGIATRDSICDIDGMNYEFLKGHWLGLGAIRIFELSQTTQFHPDFATYATWRSSDQTTALVLLRKI